MEDEILFDTLIQLFFLPDKHDEVIVFGYMVIYCLICHLAYLSYLSCCKSQFFLNKRCLMEICFCVFVLGVKSIDLWFL